MGPFADPLYRDAWTAAGLNWRGVAFGAIADDGTRAAVPLLVSERTADAFPYGYAGIAADRALTAAETRSFLEAAARQLSIGKVVVRSVGGLGAAPPHEGGEVVAMTHVVFLRGEGPPEVSYSPKAAQSIRRARRAGCVVETGGHVDSTLGLYRDAAEQRSARYPDSVIRRLVADGIARCYRVDLDGEAVSALVVLLSNDHWMYWLAAQNAVGRKAEAGYLALAAMLEDADEAGVAAVNLGASAELPGVAKFKRRFGGVERPVLQYTYAAASSRAREPFERAVLRARRSARAVLRQRGG